MVKSLSGATTSAMKHYIKPTLDKAAPQEIVLHIETNDFRDTKPETVADSIIDIARLIESESDANVVILKLNSSEAMVLAVMNAIFAIA